MIANISREDAIVWMAVCVSVLFNELTKAAQSKVPAFRKAQRKSRLQILRAPIDGIVQEMA
jgi:hypothetical protein